MTLLTWKTFLIVFSVLYLLVTIFSLYKLYYYSGQEDIHYQSPTHIDHLENIENWNLPSNYLNHLHRKENQTFKVEIWGKAAIANYLWEHILNGHVQDTDAGLVKLGYMLIENINFTYRYGPGVIQTTVPFDVQYLVLVLNGRSTEKIEAAKLWLDYIPLFTKLLKLAVVLLGDETCNNDWIRRYTKSQGGIIDVTFLVYDSKLIDNNEFYQWPLGVAVYRGFPNIHPEQVDLTSSRSLHCNFLGTVYENSSRVTLAEVIQDSSYQDDCFMKYRKTWLPMETEETLKVYMTALLKSDLTLSPVGKNTECYRIYEALSLGSVPVVEDVMTPGNCDSSLVSPLRLLKKYEAPLIYLKNWHELPFLLQHEAQLTLEEKVERRIHIAEWYKGFKINIAKHFDKNNLEWTGNLTQELCLVHGAPMNELFLLTPVQVQAFYIHCTDLQFIKSHSIQPNFRT